MENAIFGLPLSTFLTFTLVPLFFAILLIIWGLSYKGGDKPENGKGEK
jgi:hypothetical protein